MDVLEKIMMHPKTPKNAARTVEWIARAGKSMRVSRDLTRRRELAKQIPQNAKFAKTLDPVTGFGLIPKGTLSAVPAAVKFAQNVLEESKKTPRPKKAREEYLVHLALPTRYEDAPPLFDLALSDEVLQIATEYLGEVPVMLRIQVLWSPVNGELRASQLYHRDGRKWFQKRAKFVFAATDVDDSCGPFTFLPADVSERVSDDYEAFKMQARVEDDDMYKHVNKADEIPFVGPAESGLVLDTSRCFHYGSRSRGKERLLIMFQFWSPLDLPPGRGVNLRRSPAFEAKYGNDPVRMMLIPDDDQAGGALKIETD